ncbi:MAG: STAS domain-containing protein [Terracidiphilus sp.]
MQAELSHREAPRSLQCDRANLGNLSGSEIEESRKAALPDFQNCDNSCRVQPETEPPEGIALGCSGESIVVRLSGSIDIASATELKAMLLKAFEENKEIQVLTESVFSLDVTALQLLWAARNHAARRDVELILDSEPPKAIGSLLTELGMEELGLFE